jgi:hypothetical protein
MKILSNEALFLKNFELLCLRYDIFESWNLVFYNFQSSREMNYIFSLNIKFALKLDLFFIQIS